MLYRPVGLRELELIAASGARAYPPRLAHQPIFYPVVTYEYAEQIARDWNTTDETSGFAGFVTEFRLGDALADRYEIRVVGGSQHQELWVPADELPLVNSGLEAAIGVRRAFYGERFMAEIDPATNLPVSVGRVWATV